MGWRRGNQGIGGKNSNIQIIRQKKKIFLAREIQIFQTNKNFLAREIQKKIQKKFWREKFFARKIQKIQKFFIFFLKLMEKCSNPAPQRTIKV